MRDIYIVGASGSGREVAWLIEELDEWNIIGFIDDNKDFQNTLINDIPVVGGISFIKEIKTEVSVVIAIANPTIRKNIVDKLFSNSNILYPNIIAKNVRICKHVKLGKGNIVCSDSILTTNITLGDFNQVNVNCMIGHDTVLKDYITIYPSASISGNVTIENYCEFGTGSRIIQGNHIINNVIVGAGGVVIKDIIESGTYVGVPVKKIS